MDRKQFLRTVCGLGACGCAATLIEAPGVLAAAQAEAPDQRLAFARYQVANLTRFIAGGPGASAGVEAIEKTGRECAKLGGLPARFKGNPEGYFAAARQAWGTEFQWDKPKGIVTVAVAEGPCGCPLVDTRRTPAVWCHCSVGYQKEAFAQVFGREVQARLMESKLSGGTRCVFEVQVGSPV